MMEIHTFAFTCNKTGYCIITTVFCYTQTEKKEKKNYPPAVVIHLLVSAVMKINDIKEKVRRA